MDEAAIRKLQQDVFTSLCLESVEVYFSPFNPKQPNTYGLYSPSENSITFSINNLSSLSDEQVTHLVWHESVHCLHERHASQHGCVYAIANLHSICFADKQHEFTIKRILNDLMDYMVEKEIADRCACPQELLRQRQAWFERRISSITNSSLYSDKALEYCIQLKMLIDFWEHLPMDSPIHMLYSHLQTDEARLSSLLNDLSLKAPRRSAEIVCECFNMIAPLYTLNLKKRSVTGTAFQSHDLPFWLRGVRGRKVWTFCISVR